MAWRSARTAACSTPPARQISPSWRSRSRPGRSVGPSTGEHITHMLPWPRRQKALRCQHRQWNGDGAGPVEEVVAQIATEQAARESTCPDGKRPGPPTRSRYHIDHRDRNQSSVGKSALLRLSHSPEIHPDGKMALITCYEENSVAVSMQPPQGDTADPASGSFPSNP